MATQTAPKPTATPTPAAPAKAAEPTVKPAETTPEPTSLLAAPPAEGSFTSGAIKPQHKKDYAVIVQYVDLSWANGTDYTYTDPATRVESMRRKGKPYSLPTASEKAAKTVAGLLRRACGDKKLGCKIQIDVKDDGTATVTFAAWTPKVGGGRKGKGPSGAAVKY